MKYDKDRFGSPEKYIEYLQIIAQDCISLNMKMDNGEGDMETELGEVIPNTGPSVEELVLEKGNRDILLKLIKEHLSPREQQVILARYGFETSTPLTLEEIGKMYRVTRERIRQIEHVALRKLRIKMLKEDRTRRDF